MAYMIAGETRREKSLSTAGGRSVAVKVVRPEPTVENIRRLREVSDLWDAQAGAIKDDGRAQRRAYFAASVAFTAARMLETPSCCVLVAEDAVSGEVLGVGTYRLDPDGRWYLDNVTVSPANQPGRGRDQVRGVGTALLGVIANDVSARQCSDLRLYTLDRQAEEFWRNRGFHNTEEPLHMSCTEVTELARELSSSHPDEPDQGDVVLAVPEDVGGALPPAVAALIGSGVP